jgi:hypothetical protein
MFPFRPGQTEPRGHGTQFPGQFHDHPACVHSGLREGTGHAQHSGRTIGLEVHPGD